MDPVLVPLGPEGFIALGHIGYERGMWLVDVIAVAAAPALARTWRLRQLKGSNG
jgi:hypothetical protein